MPKLNGYWTILLGIVVTLITVFAIFASCVPRSQDIRSQFRQIAQPYAFNFVTWELSALFALPEEIFGKEAEVSQEAKLRKQIIDVLEDNRITVFPPILFKFTEPPHLLVVSPREEILYFDRMLLREELSDAEMEMIETDIDALGFSSLVAGLGGFGGTFPTIIGDFKYLNSTISVIVEEWFHQYLVLRPLGFLYFLDAAGIADIVSKEISSEVCEIYYPNEELTRVGKKAPDFEFNAEMRETRQKADWYLSQGKIEDAEQYMEERRKMFVENGYYIRKLNQAYFAFHGTYAYDPASVSPIYEDLKALRTKSPTLSSFIKSVAAMTSYADLRKALID